jgi:hypothetical protein
MKRFLLSCLLLFSLPATSQTITDLLLEAADHFQKGEYEKVIPLAEKVLPETEKLFGTDNPIYLKTQRTRILQSKKSTRHLMAEVSICGLKYLKLQMQIIRG